MNTPPPDDRFPDRIHLSGRGLILREWCDDDLPVMVELFDEPQVDRWPPLHAPFDLDARVAGRRIQLAIATDGHTPLGEILLFRTDQDQAAELPYVDHPALSTYPG